MERKLNSYNWVGKIPLSLSDMVDFKYDGTVYMNYGVIKHVLKKHKSQLSKQNIFDILGCIKMTIKNPDYIGSHPYKPNISLELIKYVHGNNILVAIEFDDKFEYLYVSSMYPITKAKLESRIHSKRIKRVN